MLALTSDNINLAIPIFINALPDEWLKSLDRLNTLDVDHVIPGHGEITDKNAFGLMQEKIRIWLDIISRAIKEGIDLDGTKKKATGAKEFADIPKEGPTAGLFYMNVESLYKALKIITRYINAFLCKGNFDTSANKHKQYSFYSLL